MSTTALNDGFPQKDEHEVPRRTRILIAVDDGTPSKWALQYGGWLAKELGARVTLLHVVVPDTSVVELPRTQEAFDQQARSEGANLLDRAKDLLPSGLWVECMQFEGGPADEIVLAARTWEADLIVMGTRGRNRVAEFLLGSVADGVIRRAPCPVLTVGHEPVVRTGAGEATAYQVV